MVKLIVEYGCIYKVGGERKRLSEIVELPYDKINQLNMTDSIQTAYTHVWVRDIYSIQVIENHAK